MALYPEDTYHIGCLANLGRSIVRPSKLGVDQLLAVLVQEVEHLQVRARRNLDQLSKAVSNLCNGQCPQECEIQESVHGSMIGTQAVLVVAVVDGDLDTDACVNQTNDCSRHSNEVGVASVRSTGIPGILISSGPATPGLGGAKPTQRHR